MMEKRSPRDTNRRLVVDVYRYGGNDYNLGGKSCAIAFVCWSQIQVFNSYVKTWEAHQSCPTFLLLAFDMENRVFS